jgi:hypothetical protein
MRISLICCRDEQGTDKFDNPWCVCLGWISSAQPGYATDAVTWHQALTEFTFNRYCRHAITSVFTLMMGGVHLLCQLHASLHVLMKPRQLQVEGLAPADN